MAKKFFKNCPEIKKRCLWRAQLWTQSYYVETIGNPSEEMISKLLENQLWNWMERTPALSCQALLKLARLRKKFLNSCPAKLRLLNPKQHSHRFSRGYCFAT
ncbi:MAG: hypothetical protein ACI88A_000545 [Paraglaciecola sp.]|jgi:hypothetical protein